MKQRKVPLAVFGLSLTFLMTCITVNIYFPEATVKKAAEEIVEEIRKKDEKEKQDGAKWPSIVSNSLAFTLMPVAWAQQETEVSNPAIRALKESLKNRFPALKTYFDGGNIGESNLGLVEIRDEANLGLKDRASLRNLIKEENADRMQLYKEVAKALNIDLSQVERIQKIFAESWIKSAEAGWWVQQENGDWVKKS